MGDLVLRQYEKYYAIILHKIKEYIFRGILRFSQREYIQIDRDAARS